MIRLKIPATSANLGSGFDALGVALSLYNEIEIAPADGIDIKSMDEVEVPTDESNLIYTSAKMIYDICGAPFTGLRIRQWNSIPFARGLGSSSACIVGGVLGANMLLGEPLSKSEILDLVTNLEGHPDNVAPALLGGFVTAVLENRKVWYVKEELGEDIKFIVIIPDFQLQTNVARKAIPMEISHKKAGYNLSRSALMALSLKNRQYQNLKVAAQDMLHQPYRFPYIKQGQETVDYCYALGAYAAMISGAGSTLMAIVDGKDDKFIPRMRAFLNDRSLTSWRVEGYLVDNIGARTID